MLVYLGGPMSSYADSGYNYDEFRRCAANLRDLGFDVLNPAETAGGATHLPRETYMHVDIGYVRASEAVVVMPGWENSKGAKLEMIVATSLGKPVYLYDETHGIGGRLQIDNWHLDAFSRQLSVPEALFIGGCTG